MLRVQVLILLGTIGCFSSRDGAPVACDHVEDCPARHICIDRSCTASPGIDADIPDADILDSEIPDANICDMGYSDCDGTCVNLATAPSHCGSCTRSCPSGECAAGRCLERFGQQTGANGQYCTANYPMPEELKQQITIPDPVILQKLGVIISGDGVPPYKMRIYSSSAPTTVLAETANFGSRGDGIPREFPILGGDLALDAGDYLVSFSAIDTCIATTNGVRNFWAVALR